MQHILALLCGYILDLVIGDPEWLPHPVRLIGSVITHLETRLRTLFPKTEDGEFFSGAVLAIIVPAGSLLIATLLLWVAGLVLPILQFIFEAWMCFQILAVKSLRTESMKVFHSLEAGDLEGAREDLSMIVGRDTARLDEAGITRATVETIAENTGDGIIAPLFFMALGGAPLGFFYKAISTLDSMVGYKDIEYRYFGCASARLDDIANFIPARLCGALMAVVAPLAKLDGKRAWKIFLRDRKKHESPNAAHPEAACAGALGIALGGSAFYGGVFHGKSTLGDDTRPPVLDDIKSANRLTFFTSILMLILSLAIRAFMLLF